VQPHSPLALTIAGAIALHVLAAVVGDVLVVTHPPRPLEVAPHVELVDIEVPTPASKPPPPPPVRREEPVVREEPMARVRPTRVQTTPVPEPATPPTPVAPQPSNAPGGGPVVALDNIDPSVSGSVLVAKGKRNTGGVGQGGSGGGTGGGQGAGSETAVPVSVATIKKLPKARGDYGYFAEYPTEAQRLGIEGDIKVRLVVDTAGKVVTATLINRLGHGLDEVALTRAREIEFEPALDTDNKPVTATITWTFHMTLPK